ncbi:conserved hypothetical protein [Vibrio chagasii]|nr:conserved hypothetical protein [Vibrio chagasii]CAK2978517.1 Antitoxin Xre/MbcA/ParS-like toxin-binding domain-containing protein [Vibrio crassostreae]
MKLFGYWNIPRSTQCSLLGIGLTNTNRLRAMERGIRGIPMGRDSQERINNLLAIHKCLRVLYPHNPEIRYGWVNMRNAKLCSRTPMEIMDAEGYIGIAKIRCFLNTNCQR